MKRRRRSREIKKNVFFLAKDVKKKIGYKPLNREKKNPRVFHHCSLVSVEKRIKWRERKTYNLNDLTLLAHVKLVYTLNWLIFGIEWTGQGVA